MDQKCKSLQGRWMVKEDKSSNNDADAGVLARDAKRNMLIKIKVGKGREEALAHFHILGIYSKTYNKWYNDSESQKWKKEIMWGKYRVHARMVKFDHSFGKYRDVNPLESSWGIESIYVLCDAKDIDDMLGMPEREYCFYLV